MCSYIFSLLHEVSCFSTELVWFYLFKRRRLLIDSQKIYCIRKHSYMLISVSFNNRINFFNSIQVYICFFFFFPVNYARKYTFFFLLRWKYILIYLFYGLFHEESCFSIVYCMKSPVLVLRLIYFYLFKRSRRLIVSQKIFFIRKHSYMLILVK